MRIFCTTVFFVIAATSNTQVIDSLNTAKNCAYMAAVEREMIYEINHVRSHPASYIQYLQPMLKEAVDKLKNFGKGEKNYSLTFSSSTKNGVEIKTVDTTWHYTNVEEVNALTTLINELSKLKPLPILQPDSGIYNAAKKHADDQNKHEWRLMHTGSDGSAPWDRIITFAPTMSFGNENIAANSKRTATPRDIVLQLLIDDGIPGYGHRYNLLNPSWTHVACKGEFSKDMHWWIQNFGIKKKR